VGKINKSSRLITTRKVGDILAIISEDTETLIRIEKITGSKWVTLFIEADPEIQIAVHKALEGDNSSDSEN
jgi:hypothetical protein